MPDQLVHVGNHAECLYSGRLIGPSDRVDPGELHDEDQYLVDEGRLVPVSSFTPTEAPPTKAALLKRAGELDIQGRSGMSVEELNAAVAQAEGATDAS